MKFLATKLCVLALVLLPVTSWGMYKSKKDLLNNLYQAGFDNIVQVKTSEFSFKVHNSAYSQPVHFLEFAHQQQGKRLPELDYKDSGLKSYYRAHQISSSFICYEFDSIGRRFTKKVFRQSSHANIEYCLIVPTDVDEVLNQLRHILRKQ